MEHETNLRALRHRHGLQLTELADACGLSNQYLSRAELGLIPPTPRLERQLMSALEVVISHRASTAQALERELKPLRGRLLERAVEQCE